MKTYTFTEETLLSVLVGFAEVAQSRPYIDFTTLTDEEVEAALNDIIRETDVLVKED